MSQCNITQANLHALLPGKVRPTVEIISEQMGIPKDEALKEFYNSKTYELLEKEDTKFWHFGPVTLFECFLEEKTRGTITL